MKSSRLGLLLSLQVFTKAANQPHQTEETKQYRIVPGALSALFPMGAQQRSPQGGIGGVLGIELAAQAGQRLPGEAGTAVGRLGQWVEVEADAVVIGDHHVAAAEAAPASDDLHQFTDTNTQLA